MSRTKPFSISKRVVWEAYKHVKAKQGAAGVDAESVLNFEEDLADNLYKIWNRMSSGSYFPPPVLAVSIPKREGGQRVLGVPTVSDRIAQTVVKMVLEPELEPYFHPDSYGYRPGKSAIKAVGVARQRCWRYDWVLDLDIRGFFDNMDHELVMKAVRHHTDCPWILLYVERWLKAPIQLENGSLVNRDKGTPQGSVISPLLSNLFLHYAFDAWMQRTHLGVPFERYADDVIVHCQTETEATELQDAIAERLAQCKLELHPDKTRIVYCRDGKRRSRHPHERFDFLGFTFRAREARDPKGKHFVTFTPAVSDSAAKAVRQRIRSWQLQRKSTLSLNDLSRWLNPTIHGWINYYCSYRKSALYSTLHHLNRALVRWATRKYKRLRGHPKRARRWLGQIALREPSLFAHWDRLRTAPTVG
jgi:RNA-directed DNA polymerase